jgi:hypothetical protein
MSASSLHGCVHPADAETDASQPEFVLLRADAPPEPGCGRPQCLPREGTAADRWVPPGRRLALSAAGSCPWLNHL